MPTRQWSTLPIRLTIQIAEIGNHTDSIELLDTLRQPRNLWIYRTLIPPEDAQDV
jgi:hypothetical protein